MSPEAKSDNTLPTTPSPEVIFSDTTDENRVRLAADYISSGDKSLLTQLDSSEAAQSETESK